MPADTKLTPARIKRLATLHEAGSSAREIAETIGVEQRTVRRWMAERGLVPRGKPGPHRAREKATKERPAAAPSGVQDLAVRVAKAEADLHAPGAAAAVVRARLAEIKTMVDVAKKQIEEGTGTLATYKHLVELETETATELQRLEPPPTQDPEVDPTNLAAAEKLRTKLQHAIAEARRNATCPKCGEHLYR